MAGIDEVRQAIYQGIAKEEEILAQLGQTSELASQGSGAVIHVLGMLGIKLSSVDLMEAGSYLEIAKTKAENIQSTTVAASENASEASTVLFGALQGSTHHSAEAALDLATTQKDEILVVRGIAARAHEKIDQITLGNIGQENLAEIAGLFDKCIDETGVNQQSASLIIETSNEYLQTL